MAQGKRNWVARLFAALAAFFHIEPIPRGHRRIFVYGSLKPGFFNFTRTFYIDADGEKGFVEAKFSDLAKIVAEDFVEGLTLVSLGSYPGAIEAAKKRIGGFVMDVPLAMYEAIDQMERGAGYEAQEFVTEKGRKVTVFVFVNQFGRKTEPVGELWTLDHQNASRRPRHNFA
jgi:gamma-glutamylcyclotransferase (GGCT)/AIG2-like uncharacterized protein YtfP